MPGKHRCQIVEDQVEGKVSLADKGEDGKEHCHQGEWLEESWRHADQWGQTQPSPNISHVQTDTCCIGGLHKPEVQFDQFIGDRNTCISHVNMSAWYRW